MVTDQEWTKATQDMEKAGSQHGRAAGGWIADGNTSEAILRTILKRWGEGDPVAPCPPSPFSGEWADDPSPEDMIDRETDLDSEELTPEEISELATAYEDAYTQAWYDEAERTVRGMLPDEA